MSGKSGNGEQAYWALVRRLEDFAVRYVDGGGMSPDETAGVISDIIMTSMREDVGVTQIPTIPTDFEPAEQIITGGGDGAVTRGTVTIVAKTDLVNGGYIYDWSLEGMLAPLEVASMLLGLGDSMLAECSNIAFNVELRRYRPGDTEPQ